MRPANLLMLAQGFESVPRTLLPSFEAQLSEREHPLDEVKEHEARSVIQLVAQLKAHGLVDPTAYEGFAFSFRIPQISSEFDLIKVCDRTAIDIELKIENIGPERIERQLARNRYYLAPLERTMRTFTYVANDDLLYELDDTGTLARVGFDRLVEALSSLGTPYEGRIEDLFRVSNYLVSPLNDTDRFLEGSYFLTNHQAQIKRSFLRTRADAAGTRPVAHLVYGSAGTGKSLLVYDLAKTTGRNRSTCVIHCGVLSAGHDALNQRQSGFRVVSAKGLEHVDLGRYETLLVDEAQRLWPSQLAHIVQTVVEHRQALYLSLGRRQVVAEQGVEQTAEQTVRSRIEQVTVWELSRKIRTNRELAGFIRMLFRLPGHPRSVATHDVKVCAAEDAAGAQELVEAFRRQGYQLVAYTGSRADGPSLDQIDTGEAPNASAVIGQEFDRVVMVVGRRFSLPDETLYRQLLFQGLTRARDRIALVVLDNDELLAELLQPAG